MKRTHGSGGLAAWSIRHPVGVTMLSVAVVVLGLFALGRLSVDLLPHIIYPEVRIRVLDPGVPAKIMEDRITRQLEEQLAITEDAISIQSTTSEGSSNIDLSFAYGKDIDLALRDASTRLDRAKRFLPDTIQPPVIYKRDPSQIPVAEFVISAREGDPVALRDWVDYDFSKQFLNLPGVAAVEVGGGQIREIQVLPDQGRLAALGLTVEDLASAIERGNREAALGRVAMTTRELSGRLDARFESVEAFTQLPLRLADGNVIRLGEVAQVADTHADERIRVRLDGIPGVKVSVQKQPKANTVEVVDQLNRRLAWLEAQGLIPQHIEVRRVTDQAVYVRHALNNATTAALSGTFLAMAVVYLFLGNLRRTLVIGSAIPLAMMVTFVLMGFGGLTLNIMTLGGLALGVGMLVDNTIVMLENIHRHQREGETGLQAGENAAGEIHGAIVAATSTNLAAVLPFLFVGGLVGLLFRELIFTISAAILASMVVALTLVPALAVRLRLPPRDKPRGFDRLMGALQQRYAAGVHWLLSRPAVQGVFAVALTGMLLLALPTFSGPQEFLPPLDDGEINVSISADPGISLEEMNRGVRLLDTLFQAQPEVETVFTLVGGFIFGRTERESSSRSNMTVRLVPRQQRSVSSKEWIKRMEGLIAERELAGFKVRMRTRGIRGIRISSGDDDLSVRIQGADLQTLASLGDEAVSRLRGVSGLRNIQHSAEEQHQELVLSVDRQRAVDVGLEPDGVAQGVQLALAGQVITEFHDGDRAYDVRLRLPRREVNSLQALEEIILFANGRPLRLGDIAQVRLAVAPAEIRRDNQRRIVEVSASLEEGATLGEVYPEIQQRLAGLSMPEGYVLYDGGEFKSMQESQSLGSLLLGLAVFLVFVVMAVQYESLRNPLIILVSVPFAVVGVAAGLELAALPLSMPVWLGMIMLAGIVVNNAIVLVEYMEVARRRGLTTHAAVVEAARLRLRPILMTTLTTVVGMLPLALGIGEGAEMLQPLAVSLISGLLASLLITLVLIPILYRLVHGPGAEPFESDCLGQR